MNNWTALLLLLLVALYGVVAPLWRRQADKSLGTGIETDELANLWAKEKDRLTGEQRTLDLALVNGEINKNTHGEERALLHDEATRVLKRLRKARTSSSSSGHLGQSQQRTYHLAGYMIAVSIGIMAIGSTYYLMQTDLQSDISPHVVAQASPSQIIKTEAGAQMPDIGAMVTQLELRVKEAGDTASISDLLMLGRSYRVIGRASDAIGTYRSVLDQDPANATATISLGSILLDSKRNPND